MEKRDNYPPYGQHLGMIEGMARSFHVEIVITAGNVRGDAQGATIISHPAPDGEDESRRPE